MKDLKTLKWIFNKTKSQLLNFVLLNFINILSSVLSIYLIFVSKNLIDSAISQSIFELKKYIVQLISLIFIQIALKVILSSIDAITRAKLEINLKQDVLKTVLKRDYEKISKLHSGELMTRIVSDVDIIIDVLVTLIPNILSMITKLICAAVLLFKISKQLVFVILIAGLLLFVFVNLFKPFIKNIHKDLQKSSGNVRLFFQEVIENLLVIKIFSSEDIMDKKSEELQRKKYELQMKRKSISIISTAGFNTIFQIGYLGALTWSSYNLYLKNITVGGLTSILQLISQIQAPIIGLSRSFNNLFAMFASAERIIELENIDEDKLFQDVDKDYLYENMKTFVVNNVDFTYKNKKIFDKLNFEVKKDEIIAIYGESGIGKSTLLKLMLGIIKKDNGEIYFSLNDGSKQDVTNDTRDMFAYVPQGNFIISGTIRENITFVNPDASEDEIIEALKVSDSFNFINNLENGLETKIGERGRGLSEGQLQRLAIARALISQAPILIFDEITSSLDSNTEKEVLNNIKKLQNRTCVIVTHRESISEICDREFVVENMNIKEKDKKNE